MSNGDGSLKHVLFLSVGNVVLRNKPTDVYRNSELRKAGAKKDGRGYSIVNIKPLKDVKHIYSILLTTFSVFVIVFWAESFRLDHHVYVLRPVGRMIKHLKSMAENPRLAMVQCY